LLYNEKKIGNLIEITGKKGSGKTQISFLICAINSLNNRKTVYIDGSGNFRPEKIKSMIDRYLTDNDENNLYLKNIAYKRIYELRELIELLKKIRILNFDLIVLDDIIPMFLYKFKDNTRLEVRKFIRDLSMITLSRKIMIVFTNTVTEKSDKDSKNIYLRELFFHDIIRYVHYKFYLQINPYNKKITECKLIHPSIIEHSNVYINLNNF
jgi:RecA/RadA recombinase